MAEMIKFYKGSVANLPAAGVNGALYITNDEGAIYLGTGTGMKRLGDFIQVDAVANLPVDGANASALYYCVAENILAKWNGSGWTQINKQRTAAEVKELIGLANYELKTDAEAKLTAAKDYTDAEIDKVEGYIGVIPNTSEATNIVAYVQEKTAGIATDTALEELTGRVVNAEKAIDAIEEDYLKEADKTALEGKINEKAAQSDLNDATGRIAALEDANKEGGAVAEAIAAVQDAADEAKSAADKAQADADKANDGVDALVDKIGDVAEDSTVADLISAADEKAAKGVADAATAQAAADAAQDDVDALETAFNEYKTANNDAVGKAQAAADKAQGEVDAVEDLIGEVAEGKTVVEMIADAQTAATYDDTALVGRVAAIEADYLVETDKTELQNQITANANAIELLTNGVSAEEVDGVNDLIQYVKDHGTEVTGMQDDIKANADAIASLATVASTGSWNDLADRPFYEDSYKVVLLPEESYYPTASLNFNIGELEAGTYCVKIRTNNEYNDGIEPKEYTLTLPEKIAVSDTYYVCDDNENVVARITNNGSWQIEFAEKHDSSWMSIEKEVSQIVYLDEKFIPDTIARVADQDALSDRMSDAEGKITNVEGAVATKAEKTYVDEKVEALENADSGLSGRITTLEEKFGDGEGSVADMIDDAKQDAIDAAAAAADKKDEAVLAAAKEYTDALAEGAVAANTAAIATKADQSALESHTGNTTVHITADERTAWNAAEQNAKDYADTKDEAIAAAKKAGDDAQDDIDAFQKSYATDKAALEKSISDNSSAIDTKANAADVYAKTETYTQEEVDAAIEAAVAGATTWGEF